MTTTTEQFSPSTQTRLLGLAEDIAATLPDIAQQLRTLALEGAPRTPFGYHWEDVFKKTGEVVNGGFIRHVDDDMARDASEHPEVPVEGLPGFVRRVRPLYL